MELCGLGVLKPYYFTGLEYEGGTPAIRQKFENKYIPITTGENSGIVKVRFDVNCRGETGNFEAETYNLSYKKTALNDSISNQVISIVKELDAWIPGTNEENEPVNSFRFVAVRFKKGIITQILPK